MRRFLSALCASALTAAVAVTGVVPATAAPAYVPQAQSSSQAAQSDVLQIRDKKWQKQRFDRGGRHWRGGKEFRSDRRWRDDRRSNWRGNQYRHGNGWHNGHRGYRYQRPGYRYHDGWWFPAGAFIAGAIISGAIANSNNNAPRYSGSNAHVQWCYDRYKSYRASDNTFQPYNGPRRLCYSPYS